jgi:hypothetical protein
MEKVNSRYHRLRHTLKLAWPELSDDLIDAPFMEKVNSRYHRLRHTLNGGPSQRRTVENDSEGIGHSPKIAFRRVTRIMAVMDYAFTRWRAQVSFVSSRWGRGSCAPVDS